MFSIHSYPCFCNYGRKTNFHLCETFTATRSHYLTSVTHANEHDGSFHVWSICIRCVYVTTLKMHIYVCLELLHHIYMDICIFVCPPEYTYRSVFYSVNVHMERHWFFQFKHGELWCKSSYSHLSFIMKFASKCWEAKYKDSEQHSADYFTSIFSADCHRHLLFKYILRVLVKLCYILIALSFGLPCSDAPLIWFWTYDITLEILLFECILLCPCIWTGLPLMPMLQLLVYRLFCHL